MTDELDEASAAEHLRTLEQAAVDGRAVKPSELAEARERVTLAGLSARGRAERAAAEAAQAQASAQAAAKAEAARIAADLQFEVRDAKQLLTTAIKAIITAIDDHNASVEQIRDMFDAAGLPLPAAWGQINPMDVDGLDHRNYAWIEQGGVLSHVMVAGQTHSTLDRRRLLTEALSAGMLELGLGRTVKIEP